MTAANTAPTADTRRELLAAIAREPDEDTPRLIYADWLDEQEPLRVKCPDCKGTSWVAVYATSRRTRCLRCELLSGGTILDASDRDRAELIRLECNYARIPGGPSMPHPLDNLPELERKRLLLKRDMGLLAAHPEWLAAPCPTCKDKPPTCTVTDGVTSLPVSYTIPPMCPTCHGAGDLMRRLWERDEENFTMSLNPPPPRRSHTFRRGFMESVSLTLAEAMDGEKPSKLASGLVTAFPTITRMPLSDCEPEENQGQYGWFDPMLEHAGPDIEDRSVIPLAVFFELDKMTNGKACATNLGLAIYPTREAAIDALAVAMCRLAKKEAIKRRNE